jgi:DnaK suppressor protein
MSERLDRDELRALLLARRAELAGDSAQIRKDALDDSTTGEGHGVPSHLADAASDVHEREFLLERLSTSSGVLQQIDEALERVQTDRYGLCEECGHPIPPRRLQITPWASLCVECQRKEEQG